MSELQKKLPFSFMHYFKKFPALHFTGKLNYNKEYVLVGLMFGGVFKCLLLMQCCVWVNASLRLSYSPPNVTYLCTG